VVDQTSAFKKMMKRFTYCLLILLALSQTVMAGKQKKITVARTGKADFRSIQAAINSLSDSSARARWIYIKNGVYDEKLYIEKHNIVLEGQSREGVIVTQAIARDEWRCLHNDDWGVATMNVDGNDITLLNLTIKNSYGFDRQKDITIVCPQDTVAREKKLRKDGHQMALRTMHGTRLSAINCHFLAYGGDTVSPWDVDNGMFYFKDCVMEGGVDFYCPRGWAYAEGCRFISHTGPAAIWHDGSKYEDSKTVLKNCSFEGYDGFKLGRFHRDAQFFLVNCVFADNMADEDIYLVKTNNLIRWGKRVYYFNCHRKSGNDFNWHKNNLNPSIDTGKINSGWVFGNRWKPGLTR
jgi:pectinesterase